MIEKHDANYEIKIERIIKIHFLRGRKSNHTREI